VARFASLRNWFDPNVAAGGDEGLMELFDAACEQLEDIPDHVHENVATIQAEYLTVAYETAEAGFDTFAAAAEHATDTLVVKNAYEGTSGC
jgi:hypothetical protein